MKNYLSTLKERDMYGWGGYHSKGANTVTISKHGHWHFCPVQTDNMTDENEMVDIFYNLTECAKSDIDDAKRIITSMIETLTTEYGKVAQITVRPVIEEIKAVYAGNNTTRFTIRVTTPVMKDGRYLVDDILGRYHGNLPESNSTKTAIYKIKPIKAA